MIVHYPAQCVLPPWEAAVLCLSVMDRQRLILSIEDMDNQRGWLSWKAEEQRHWMERIGLAHSGWNAGSQEQCCSVKIQLLIIKIRMMPGGLWNKGAEQGTRILWAGSQRCVFHSQPCDHKLKTIKASRLCCVTSLPSTFTRPTAGICPAWGTHHHLSARTAIL